MFNPFIHDLDKLSDEELSTQHQELIKKQKMIANSPNDHLKYQLQIAINHYTAESKKRMQKALEDAKLKEQDRNLTDLINVDKQ
jgi:hypothetical protein